MDPSLSVDEAGAECIIALAVEKAGRSYASIKNPMESAFKAGECTGKIQSYMLRMQAENPGCFPKISLEEGMDIFVKWAAANAYRANAIEYPEGFRQAFEAAVPCLKK